VPNKKRVQGATVSTHRIATRPKPCGGYKVPKDPQIVGEGIAEDVVQSVKMALSRVDWKKPPPK